MHSILESSAGAANGRSIAVEFRQPQSFSGYQMTLIPAGNDLGSAQVLIESDAGNLFYMSDFGWDGKAVPSFQTGLVSTLVIETIYGHPKYRFPPPEDVIRQIVRFCVESLEEGEIPVLLGLPWSKAQDIFTALAAGSLPIALHPVFWKWAQAYENAGGHFSPYEKIVPGNRKSCVFICPGTGIQEEGLLSTLPRKRIAILTGEEPQLLQGLHYDAIFPISEHPDYECLLRHVEAIRPQQVLTFHGFAAEFASDLRSRGHEAWALCCSNQLEFSLSTVWFPASVAKPESQVQLERTGFGRFCLLCEKVAAATSQLDKIKLLQGFLHRLSDPELSRVCAWLTGEAFSRCSKHHGKVEWAVIRQALIGATGLPEEKFQALTRFFEEPGAIAAQVLLHQLPRRRMEISDLQATFVRLRDFRNPSDQCEFLKEFFASVSAMEAQVIVRILTGIGLKESLVEKSIAAAFARDLGDVSGANTILGDIGRAAVLARRNRLETAEMTLFRPIRPMLPSTERDFTKIWERMSRGYAFSGSMWVEEKLDGIRAQVHTDGVWSQIYTRDLRNITSLFPEIAQAACRLGHRVVLDGELIPNAKTERPEFFRLQKILGQQEGDLFSDAQISTTFLAFDLLFLDDLSLFRKPLYARRAALESLEICEPLRLVSVSRPSNLDELHVVFQEACAANQEGLIAKEATSTYMPGRRVLSWIKMKKKLPTLDVVVIGVEYGGKNYGQSINHLIFALRRTDGSLVTAGRVCNTLTENETLLFVKQFQTTTLFHHDHYHEVQPTVVIEIVFDSIQRSTRSESGFIFHGPRLRCIREDKTSFDVDTLEVAGQLCC